MIYVVVSHRKEELEEFIANVRFYKAQGDNRSSQYVIKVYEEAKIPSDATLMAREIAGALTIILLQQSICEELPEFDSLNQKVFIL